MTAEDWSWVLGTNLSGPFHLIRCFVPAMRARGSGHVVNVASAGGLARIGLPGA